ncbi:uncharacterized protein LOC133310278 [Gastrolobium bilobum]|uniref:uncharacterized protein LOC133310278 n=1 Tax=Gastrolobium bilobum TaxID=150636 RepID=UPI002AB0DE44|nr:uncharacterized protein LOC133310278 [Gastrolobium bilobum]
MIESGLEMLKTLDGMFAISISSAGQNGLIAVTKITMTGGSVRDHCLTMIANFKQADDNVIKFAKEVKVDLLLQSLPEYFNQFKINYSMNKMNMDLTHLMHDLENAEQSLVKQWFKHSLPISQGQRILKLGNGELVSALAEGQVVLSFDNF